MTNVTGGTKVGWLAYFSPVLTLLALVTRARNSSGEGLRLKTAAAMAEGGEIRETVERLWTSGGIDQEELASRVGSCFSCRLTC